MFEWDGFVCNNGQVVLDAYKKEGKSVYTESFIEDNEEKVKALQAEYPFTYTIELR